MKSGFIMAIGLVLTLLYSCTAESGSQETPPPARDSVSLANLPVPVGRKMWSIYDWIDTVEFVRLEEPMSVAAFDDLYEVLIANDQFIVPDYDEDRVLVYDIYGVLKKEFEPASKMDFEFPGFNNAFMQSDTIVVANSGQGTIARFTLEGELLDTLQLPLQWDWIHYYDGKYYLDVSLTNLDEVSSYFKLLSYDPATGAIEKFLPQSIIPDPVNYPAVNSFSLVGQGILFQPAFQDTLFLISEKGVAPDFTVDFGNKFMWDRESMLTNSKRGWEFMQLGGLVWTFDVNLGYRDILVNYSPSLKESYMYLFNRQSGGYVRFNTMPENREHFGLSILSSQGDWTLFWMPGREAYQFTRRMKSGFAMARKGTDFSKTQDSETPVLMWVKFREVPVN